MSKARRQQILLSVLLVILVVVAWWRYGSKLIGDGSGAPGRAALAGFSDRSGGGEPGALPEVVDLRLDDLQEVSGELDRGRNPFGRSQPEAPPPPEPSADDLREAMVKARLEQEREVPVAIEPAKPKPPPVDVVFLGSFGPSTKQFAVFTDGSEIFNVGEGGILKDKFIVERIGFESADLGFVDFPDAPAQRLEIGG